MDNNQLLELGPNELARALLQRRMMLKDSLPGVIRNLEAEEESIVPKLERLEKSFEGANQKVAELKMKRDENQSRASALIQDVKSSRAKLLEGGGMMSLDPKWKKRRMMEDLEGIEHKIQTSALDHKAERKLLEERRKIVEENDRWLKDRKESNPEMVEYSKNSKEMSDYYRIADKAHAEMLTAVEKAQPTYEKRAILSNELREVRSQLDRARELLSQSDKAISHWERRLEEGFGDIGPGFSDLLIGMRRVENGGVSSFAKRRRSKKKESKQVGGEEE
ncbi:MAG: hypothetical protein QGH38_01035 [Candidatus Thalassarchaeaceae archaeon]|jgi:uncharacterized coiled-coil DUF342 family protein|nr:hypothetical protein [Candidatus Thalassarchaeaceae archaeon]MEE2629299.1 hypothetical protein [Candidatus Thermoplasmatota archaeon]